MKKLLLMLVLLLPLGCFAETSTPDPITNASGITHHTGKVVNLVGPLGCNGFFCP